MGTGFETGMTADLDPGSQVRCHAGLETRSREIDFDGRALTKGGGDRLRDRWRRQYRWRKCWRRAGLSDERIDDVWIDCVRHAAGRGHEQCQRDACDETPRRGSTSSLRPAELLRLSVLVLLTGFQDLKAGQVVFGCGGRRRNRTQPGQPSNPGNRSAAQERTAEEAQR